ncbi:MAG: RND family transporter [Deltaproteobacteria bacterium]|nr:RND family transporter [Deltaproteobacteria bacterium]
MDRPQKKNPLSLLHWFFESPGLRISQGLLRYRFFILSVICLLFLGSIYQIFELRADFSLEALILTEDEEGKFFEEFKERFEESDRDIIVLLQGETLFRPDGVALIQQLTEALEEVDGVEKVVTALNAPLIRGTEEGVRIESLTDLASKNPSEIGGLKQKALDNRMFRRTLISEDGKTLALLARLDPDVVTEKQKRPVVRAITSTTESIIGDQFPIYFSGMPVIQEEYTSQGLKEVWVFFVLSAGILCVFLFITFRNILGLYVPQLTVITSVVFLLGLMSLFHQELNIISNVIPSLLLVYGIADSIHLINRYYEELDKGLSKKEALLVIIRRMGVACFMTSFTTTVGFLSLYTASIKIIKTFGLFSGIGIFIAYLVTILLIPILLSLRPAPKRKWKEHRGDDAIERIMVYVGRLNERHPKILISLGILIFAGSALLCTRVNTESYILEELTEDNPIVQANDIMEKEMTGIFPYQIQVSTGREGLALEPDFLARVDELESFVASQPWIRKSFSIVDILKEMHQAMNGGDPTFYRLPETRELVAQYLLLYGMSGNQEDLDVLITPDGSYIRIASQGVDMGSHNYFELKHRTEEKAASLFEPPASYRVTGRSLLATRALSNIVRDMLVSFFSAFGIIFVAVSLLYRSVKAGLITMIPNVIPLVVTLGFMGLFGITLRLSTVVIFAICLGMAVDDTIHYLTRFREELRRTGDYVLSMYTTLRTAGRAIVLTTLIMIAGFLVFLSSGFKATQDFGLLTSVALTSSLLGSLIFLPAALNTLKPWKLEDLPIQPGREAS